MRKSKHNMFKKIETFVQAIQDRGSVDMDTHELSNLVKDTFTKRRAKTFYADIFSSMIGEPDKEAPTFACNKTSADGETITPSTWALGSEVIYNVGETSGHFDPYVVFLTDEQKSKLQITVNSTVDEMPADMISEELQALPIPDEDDNAFLIGRPADCNYMFYGQMLGLLSQLDVQLDRQLLPGEYVKITITYDGVDYVYQS